MRNRIRFLSWRILSIFVDTSIAAIAFMAAYVVVYSLERVLFVPGFLEKTVSFVLVSLISFFIFSVQRGSWRYVSLPEVVNLVKAVLFAVVVYTVGAFLLTRGENVPRSVPILVSLFMIAGLAGIRMIYRLAVEGQFISPLSGRAQSPGQRRVLVLGFTNAAESFIRSSRRTKNSTFAIAGILDDGGLARSQSIQGVSVYGGFEDLPKVVAKFAERGMPVSELVVAELNPGRQRLSEIVERATALGLKTTRIPGPTETSTIDSQALVEPKPIELSDLLGRPEVRTNVQDVASLIRGRKVLATGAGGSIGSELVRQIAQFEPSCLVLTDNSEHNTYLLDTEIREKFPELDIVTQLVSVRDTERLEKVFSAYKPDLVFHVAALKHVPLVEANPIEGIKTNVLGTRNVADAAVRHEAAAFVMISTDKAVNPTNIMGATKRAAEAYCQAMDLASQNTRFKTVRFGNVLGSNGSVVPRFKEQILEGGPVTVTHPHIIRYFMTIPEAVRLVLHASSQALQERSERGKIMVLDMGKPVRIVDLAERMIQLAGFKVGEDVKIVFTGLRPGEKLYEELFDPSEVQDGKSQDGYVVAAPRIVDQAFLARTLKNLEKAAIAEDEERALQILKLIVPEYRPNADQFLHLETELPEDSKPLTPPISDRVQK